MDKTKRAKLKAAGWTIATPKEFLKDTTFVEVKVAPEGAQNRATWKPRSVSIRANPESRKWRPRTDPFPWTYF